MAVTDLIRQEARLPESAHTSQPWRIHELTSDFRVEDVWALPTPGGPADFPRLVEMVTSIDPGRSSSVVVRTLFTVRMKMGELLRLDAPESGIGSRVSTLRDRLPSDLADAPRGPHLEAVPFSPIYLLEDEWALEVANRTVHGVLHLGWVPDGSGGYRGQMAVIVKPNGVVGRTYLAAILPFRYLLVYPRLLRGWERKWRDLSADPRRDL